MRSLLFVGVLLLCQESATFSSCDNGGFLLNDTCNCPSFWSSKEGGDKGCTEIVCVNEGYALPGSKPQRCVCPSGYLGIHCEAVTTFIPHSNLFKQSAPTSSFTLVYVNLLSNYYGGLVYTQFKNALERIIGINFVKNWLITNSNTPNFIPGSILSPESYNFTTQNCTTPMYLPPPMSPVQFSCYGAPFYQTIIDHIKKNAIRETAITILTQHPALDVSLNDTLVTLCQSFDIRINVVFSDDQTFVRCTPDDTQQLRLLSKMTGGIFVTAKHNPDYAANGTIIDMVLQSHIAYEPITMSTNGTVKFTMNIPLDNKQYYIVAYGNDGNDTVSVTTSSCKINDAVAIMSDDNVYAYPVSFNPSCTISFTNTDRIEVFGSNMTIGPISVKLYKSYLQTVDLDTSKIQPVKGDEHYVSIHVENTGSQASKLTAATFNQGGESSPLTMTTRSGVMEYISTEKINCDPIVYPAWIQLTLKEASATEFRYIPVFCQNWAGGSTSSGMSFEERTYWNTGERQMVLDNAPATIVDPDILTQKTFVLGYSDLTTQNQQNSFLLGSAHTPFVPYKDFGEIRFDINSQQNLSQLVGEPAYHNQSTFGSFADSVYGTYGWNAAYQARLPTDSQVMLALEILAKSDQIKQNSLITMNLARVVDPKDSRSNVSTVYPLVNKNIKVLMFIDKSTLNNQYDTLSPAILNQVAAVTSGHFIVCNENDNDGFKSLLTTIFSQGPGQNLLLARNFVGVTPPTNVGTLYLSGKSADKITMTLTFSTNVDSNNGTMATAPIAGPLRFKFSISGKDPVFTTLTQIPDSNFYTANVTLQGGFDVQVNLVQPILCSQPSLLRIWTSYLTNDDVQICYKDLLENDKEPGGGPDDFPLLSKVLELLSVNGAIPVVSLYNTTAVGNSTLSVTYLDCAGNYIDLYDGKQSLSLQSSITGLRYVPYFCTALSSNCTAGTENLYYSQYRSNTGFVATKTFICAQAINVTADGCNNTDSRGNYLCGGSQPPYRRGRAGRLIDCSDPYSSHLSYDSTVMTKYASVAPFKCNCGGDADQGPSCENSDCTGFTNTDGGAVDTLYRTYSIVVAISPQMTGTSAAALLFTDAKSYLVPTDSVDNIWQYQLFAACPNGAMTTLFIGTDFGLFQKSFANVPSYLCSEDNATDYDLTMVYQRVVSSVGKQQRGLIVFYHEMDSFISEKVTVADTEAFISQAQQYQQQMYVFNLFYSTVRLPSPITPELISALMSTGGNVVLGQYGDDDDDPAQLPIHFFTKILSQSVSLNALEKSTTAINTVIETSSYVVLTRLDSNRDSSFKDLIQKICPNVSDQNVDEFGAVCFVPTATTISIPSTLTRNISYSVVAIGDSSPVGIFITQRNNDSQTSVPVNYTTGGPTLAIYSPVSYTTQNNLNNNARDADRKSSCTYKRSTVDVFGQLKPGFNSIKMKTQYGNPGATVTKVYPFGVSHEISCKNGALPKIGYGQCACDDEFWEGPDCSRPKCWNTGTLSTWSNACNCPSKYTGRFCEVDKTQAPSTTAASATAQSSTVSQTTTGN